MGAAIGCCNIEVMDTGDDLNIDSLISFAVMALEQENIQVAPACAKSSRGRFADDYTQKP